MPQETTTLYHSDGRTREVFPHPEVLKRQAELGFKLVELPAPEVQDDKSPKPRRRSTSTN